MEKRESEGKREREREKERMRAKRTFVTMKVATIQKRSTQH